MFIRPLRVSIASPCSVAWNSRASSTGWRLPASRTAPTRMFQPRKPSFVSRMPFSRISGHGNGRASIRSNSTGRASASST